MHRATTAPAAVAGRIVLRLHRQPAPGDWTSVIARVRTDLAALVAERAKF